jgi:hypothetical protein
MAIVHVVIESRHIDSGRVETANLYQLTKLARSLDEPLVALDCGSIANCPHMRIDHGVQGSPSSPGRGRTQCSANRASRGCGAAPESAISCARRVLVRLGHRVGVVSDGANADEPTCTAAS